MRRVIWFGLVVTALGLGGMAILNRSAVINDLTGQKEISESRLRSLQLNSEGVDLLNAKDVDSALARFREAAAIDPADDMINRNLSLAVARKGQQLEDDGDADGARARYEESLSIWDDNPEALEMLATLSFGTGNYKRAEEAAARLAAIYPDRSDIKQFLEVTRVNLRETAGMVAEKGQYFRVLYSDERRLQFEGELLSSLQTEMDSLTAALGVFPAEPVVVMILTGDMGARADQVDPMVEGVYDGRIRLYYDAIEQGGEGLRHTVRHEMVHALLHSAAGVALPAWFHEGVAQKMGDEPSETELADLRRRLSAAVLGGLEIDLGSMGDSFLSMPARRRAEAYASSLLFVDYLTRRFGDRIIPIMVMNLGDGQDLESSLAVYTGKNLRALQTGFLTELKRGG